MYLSAYRLAGKLAGTRKRCAYVALSLIFAGRLGNSNPRVQLRASMSFSATARFTDFPLCKGSANREGVVDRLTLGAELADEDLLTHVRVANSEALALLFYRHARLVRAVAYRILRDAAEADDLLQEVFLFIQRKADTFDGAKSSARSWIVHLAYERAIDRRRYLNTRHFYTSVELDSDSVADLPDPRVEEMTRPEALDAVTAKDKLLKALDALPNGQRETLRLYFFEGYTLREIAVKLGQTLGNVRNHYYRGLEKLRQHMFAKKLPGGTSV